MTGINWNLAVAPNIGETINTGFQRGQAMRKEHDAQNALAAYAADPSAANANALMVHKPELALKLQEAQREQAFGNAAARLIGGGNALLPTRPGANGSNQGSLPGRVLGAVGGGIGGGIIEQRERDMRDPQARTSQPPANPDFKVLGPPQNEADEAFLQMLQVNPKKAMEIDSQLRDRAADRLKLQRDAYGFAVSRLGGATDEPSYQEALGDIQRAIEPLGVNVADHLPPSFPGADGLRRVRMTAMTAKEQLAQILNEEDTAADNTRADRNTESQIADRQARTGIARERVDVTRDLGVRRDNTARRGQDVRAATTQRGQDMRGSGREKIVAVSTPAEAMKLAPGTKFRTPDGKVKVR